MSDDWPTVRLGDIARVDRGASWSKDQETDGSVGDPVIRIANVQPGGLDLREVRKVLGLKPREKDRARIERNSLLMVGSNGNPERIGNVYRCQDPIAGGYLASFLIGIHVDDDLTSRWLHLYLGSDPVQRKLSEATVGSTGLKNLSIDWLRGLQVPVPDTHVQRRIVDLIAAVDGTAEALAAEAHAGAELEGPLFQALVASGNEGAESVQLGEVGEFVRGRRFTKAEYVPSGLGCIHYGQIHTHFGPIARKSLTFLLEESRARLRLARPGDVVIAATSEDIDGLGKATVWLGDDDVAVHDDCYIFRHMLDPIFASYVFASPWFQHQKRQYAGGTKVTRISGADLARIAVPIPPIAVQVRVGEALGALSDQVNAVGVELEAVRRLRASLLTALLSRRVEIPEAHDYLVDAGVA